MSQLSSPDKTFTVGAGHSVGKHQRISLLLPAVCLFIIMLAGLASLALGDTLFSWSAVFQALTSSEDSMTRFIIMELRMPRLLTGLLAGAALGMAGCIVQSITRNPLGTPDLMGVSAGASFAIVLGFVVLSLPPSAMLVMGTAGGFAAGFLTFAIAWKTHLNPIHLTLSGMSIALFFTAGLTLLLVSADSDVNGLYYWLAGSLLNRTWQHVNQLWLFVFLGLGMGVIFSRPLNLLMLDDMTSRALGFPVQRWRLILGLTSVVLTAATVAVAGPISFVGLVAPHAVKLLLKQYLSRSSLSDAAESAQPLQMDHRILLPLSAIVGATLVCVADLVARIQEVPVGILCILTGGPLFVYLIRKQGGYDH